MEMQLIGLSQLLFRIKVSYSPLSTEMLSQLHVPLQMCKTKNVSPVVHSSIPAQ